ncbi:hypothetical protein [Aliiglaciecola sp. NS0011-25]|uniref:hypothetical protein n=1 Tax=Aliiglaciecola sp. NS0011-25 TaxID=3127654 RepID=UPI00310C4CF9
MKTIILKVTYVSLLLALSLFANSLEKADANQPIVKKSASGMCHDNSSASYSRTKSYIPYKSIAACIAEGGRLPKSKVNQKDKATEEAVAEGREFVSLYNRGVGHTG